MKKYYVIILLAILMCVRLYLSHTMHQAAVPEPVAPPQKISLHIVPFQSLDGWRNADLHASLTTFHSSCKALLKRPPAAQAGSPVIPMTVQDWIPVCKKALRMPVNASSVKIRSFFEHYFKPVSFHQEDLMQGLFTGYYMPKLKASLVKTSEYHVPVYGVPDDMLRFNIKSFDKNLPDHFYTARITQKEIFPYYTRQEIDNGAIAQHAPVLVWVTSFMDRLDLEIQGSGVAELPNKERIYLGYAAQNGAPYTPVARVLIDKKILTRDTASMQAIRRYFLKHPEDELPVMHQNASFVFFKVLDQKIALGAQGVGLTPGYSMAVDKQFIPLGAPLWLSTTHPAPKTKTHRILQRLMIAQDTGGAIKGVVRGDVYWGAGKKAFYTAGKMRNPGHYWILLPRSVILPTDFILP